MFLCSQTLLKAFFLLLSPCSPKLVGKGEGEGESVLTKEFLKLILSFSCAKSIISQEWAELHANTNKLLHLDAECCM